MIIIIMSDNDNDNNNNNNDDNTNNDNQPVEADGWDYQEYDDYIKKLGDDIEGVDE